MSNVYDKVTLNRKYNNIFEYANYKINGGIFKGMKSKPVYKIANFTPSFTEWPYSYYHYCLFDVLLANTNLSVAEKERHMAQVILDFKRDNGRDYEEDNESELKKSVKIEKLM